MSSIERAIALVRDVGETPGGLTALAQESGVPYTTIHSFYRRGWQNKNLDNLIALERAARHIVETAEPIA